MVSFLKKLRGEGLGENAVEKKTEDNEDIGGSTRRLDLDVFQTAAEIVMYAPIYGSRIEDVDVAVEGDNDVITIKGRRTRPEEVAFEGVRTMPDGKFYAEEIHWGEFYRQIILPQEIDADRAEAKLKNGILILVLPLVRSISSKAKKMEIIELDEQDEGTEEVKTSEKTRKPEKARRPEKPQVLEVVEENDNDDNEFRRMEQVQ